MAVVSSMAQLVVNVTSCLGLPGVLAQVSFDTEGEFVAKHIRQTQCANFVARLVSLSFAELDALGLGWRLSIDALYSRVG